MVYRQIKRTVPQYWVTQMESFPNISLVYCTYSHFPTYLLYTLVLHKQIFAGSTAWISKYVVKCLQHTASFVLALTINNRVRICTATSIVIVTVCVTVLPSIRRFQNVDLSSTVPTNGRWVRFTNCNGQWVYIKCRRNKMKISSKIINFVWNP